MDSIRHRVLTHGATPGEHLFDILKKVRVSLYKAGAIVKSVVCDGATTQKRWHLSVLTEVWRN